MCAVACLLFSDTSIEARLWRASLLWRSGNGVPATAFGQQRFGNGGNFANGLVLVLQQQYLHDGITHNSTCSVGQQVNDDGCLEPWQARGSMLNDT